MLHANYYSRSKPIIREFHHTGAKIQFAKIAFPFTKKIVYSYVIGHVAIRPLNTLGAKYRKQLQACAISF